MKEQLFKQNSSNQEESLIKNDSNTEVLKNNSLEYFKKISSNLKLTAGLFLATLGAEAQQCAMHNIEIRKDQTEVLKNKAHEVDSLCDVLLDISMKKHMSAQSSENNKTISYYLGFPEKVESSGELAIYSEDRKIPKGRENLDTAEISRKIVSYGKTQYILVHEGSKDTKEGILDKVGRVDASEKQSVDIRMYNSYDFKYIDYVPNEDHEVLATNGIYNYNKLVQGLDDLDNIIKHEISKIESK